MSPSSINRNINKNRLLIAIIATLGAIQVNAVPTTTNATATVIVQNAITVTNTDNLDFGTIASLPDILGATNIATLTIPADAAAAQPAPTASGAAYIYIITPGAPVTFQVSGVAPGGTLTITLPVAATTLSGTTSTSTFKVDSWAAFITSGPNATSSYTPGTPNLVADASGNVEFSVGATLSTDDTVGGTNTGTYDNETFTGTFDVIVDY